MPRTAPRRRAAWSASPWPELARLLRRARRAGHPDPDAMALATSGRGGRPSVRMVLLRGVGPRGLLFYTNYLSRKGRELARTPRAAVVFYWADIARQVRVEGRVRRLSAAESDAYFATRPRDARLAAWTSEQSAPIRDRAVLLARFRALRARFAGREVERPPHWGGFRLVPDTYEFWAGRAHRLHDRVRFTRRGERWVRERLAP